jgi:hypothetical protein
MSRHFCHVTKGFGLCFNPTLGCRRKTKVMIDVAIALGLIYLMFAGLVSGIQELFAMAFQLRGRMLRKGVASLLSGATAASQNGRSLSDEILTHPMIAVLRDGDRLPSYVPSTSFSTAFTDALTSTYRTDKPLFEGLPEAVAKLPEGDLKRSIGLLVLQAEGDAEKLRTLLEGHFDKVMDRVSGWYKRRSQIIILVIASVAAVALNIDTISIAQRLSRDTELRQSLVRKASETVANGESYQRAQAAKASASGDQVTTEQITAQLKAVQQDIQKMNDLRIPIGWEVGKHGLEFSKDQKEFGAGTIVIAIVGWMISALAASLGAPFWFDAISKLVSLRTAGARPSTPPDAALGGTTKVVIQSPPAPATVTNTTDPAPSPGPWTDFESTRLNELDIEQLQRALGMPEAAVSATLDEPTRAALRDWQTAHGRTATGVFDEATVVTLLHGPV